MKSKTRTFMVLCLILSLSAGISHVLFLRVLVLEPEEQFFWTYRYDKGSTLGDRLTIQFPLWFTYIDGIWVVGALIFALDAIYLEFVRKREVKTWKMKQ